MKKIMMFACLIAVAGIAGAAVSGDYDVVSVETAVEGKNEIRNFAGEIIDFDQRGMFFRSAGNYDYFFSGSSIIRLNKKGQLRKNEFPSGRQDIARFYKSISSFDAEFFSGGTDSLKSILDKQALKEIELSKTGALSPEADETTGAGYKVEDYFKYKSSIKNPVFAGALGIAPGFGAGHFYAGDFATGAVYLAVQAAAASAAVFYADKPENSGLFYAGVGIFACAAMVQTFTSFFYAEAQNSKTFKELRLDKVNFISAVF